VTASIGRRAAAEGIGTALLLAAIVGSGIMAERLAGGNLALALLANSLATGGALVALILTFAPISGAHFNPAVTMAVVIAGHLRMRDTAPYIAAQITGAVLGVWLAHLMFDLPLLEVSARERSGLGQWTGEFIATFGLIALIESGRRRFAAALPGAVAAYITAAYWFTSSTSFANPAVTLARALSNTFAGIGPGNVPAFIAAQLAGAAAAIVVFRWFYRREDVATRSSGR
jgi:glycerol uptake facilitator-like aquaporin